MVWILRTLFIIFFVIHARSALGIFGINLFRAYDINLRPPIWRCEPIQITPWTEIGYKARGYNPEGNEVNSLQLWTPKQDAIAMLRGFGPDSPMTQFFVEVLDSPEDNGIRGNLVFDGQFKAKEFALSMRYHAPYHITLGLHLPFFEMSLKNVTFTDCTRDINAEDMLVKQELTSQLKQRVAMFDPSLNLDGWKRIGPGDLFLLAEWQRQFYQGRPILKNVGLCARGGFAFPTGLRTDEDEILSVPFGFDGSLGLIFGGGIDITWFDIFKGGIDVEFIELFGNTRNRRIKVFPDQTEFLLLAKAPTFKDFGFTQRFNLYLESRFRCGIYARLTYQFWKHSPDTLSLCVNEFSDAIANTAQSLEQWTNHHLIAMLTYDGQFDIPEKNWFKPQFSVFYKFPFNGERALMLNTFGFIFSLNF